MSILSGFFRTIKYRLTDEGYKWQSEKTSSQTVVMGDGTDNTDTLEKRAGSIKGLTSAVSVTETGYALDATIGKKHEDAITTLNNNLANKQDKLSKTLTNAKSDSTYGIIDLEIGNGYFVESVVGSDGFAYLPFYSHGKQLAVCISVSEFKIAKNHTCDILYISYHVAD